MMRLEVASFVGLFALLHVAKGHEVHPGSCPWIPAVPHFDIEKFLGNWYSISKTPPLAPCVTYHVAGTAEHNEYILTEYSELGEDRYKYKFSGYLKVVFPNDPGKLLLEYLPNPLGYRYHVFATDYEHYAGVFVCQNFGLFHRSSIILLSRQRTLDAHYMDAMIGKLQQFKIPMGDLDLIDQHVCLHDRIPQQETVVQTQIPHFEDHQKHEVQQVIHPDVQHAVNEGTAFHTQVPQFEDHQKPVVQEFVIHTQVPQFEDHQKHEVQQVILPDVQHAVHEGTVVHTQLPHFEDQQKPEVEEIIIHTQLPQFEDHQKPEVQEIIHPDVQHAVEEGSIAHSELQHVDHQQHEILEVTEPNVQLAVNEGDASLSNANADAAVGEVQGGAAITEPPVVDPVDQDVVLSIPPAEEAETVPTTEAAQPVPQEESVSTTQAIQPVPQVEVTTVISVVEHKKEHAHDHDSHGHQQHQEHVENNDVQKTTDPLVNTAVTTDESPEIDERIVDGTQAVEAEIGTFFPKDDQDSSPAALETAARIGEALETDQHIDDTQFVQSQINTFFPHRSQHSSRAMLDTQVQIPYEKQQISTFNVEMPEPKSIDLNDEQPDAYWDNQDTAIDFIEAYAKLLALKNNNDTDQKGPSLGQVSSTMFGEIQTFTDSSSPGISTNEILPNSKPIRVKPTPGTHTESFAKVRQQVDTQDSLSQPSVSKPVLAVGANNEDIGIASRFGSAPGFKKPPMVGGGDFVFPDQVYINHDAHHRGFRDLSHGPSIDGFGQGNGYGFGRGRGYGFGRGRGQGFRRGRGHAFGHGHAFGTGHGFGHGHGHGFGYGHGFGHGHGLGFGHGHGHGHGFGHIHGNGFEHGHGHGHHGYDHGHAPDHNNCHGNGYSFLDEPYVTPTHPEAELMQLDSHLKPLDKPCTNCDLKLSLDPRIDVSNAGKK